ncbi:MAG: hypothetical protein Q4C22_01090, partial [Bacillota bacterium]|nr:hypothetical protein [Bacillota bacterium]
MNEKKGRKRFARLEGLMDGAGISGVVNISGIAESRVAAVAGFIAEKRKGQSLIVVPSYERARRLAADLSFFSKLPVYVMPEEEQSLIRYDAKSRDYLEQRLRALTALVRGEDCVVVADGAAAVRKLPPKDLFTEHAFSLKKGAEAEPGALRQRLIAMGYEGTPAVEAPGQFSARGGILDLWPMGEGEPFRVEFFDTEVDSIRRFDPQTQRSLENCREAEFYPAAQIIWSPEIFRKGAERIAAAYNEAAGRLPEKEAEALRERKAVILEAVETRTNLQLLEHYLHYFYEKPQCLWDYPALPVTVMVDDPDRVSEALSLRETEYREHFRTLLERGQAAPGDHGAFSGRTELMGLYG